MKKRIGLIGIAGVGVALQAKGVSSPDTIEPQEGNGKSVAIVGSGAVGLLQGYEMAKKGYNVTIIDARSDVSQSCTGVAAGAFSTDRRLPDWGTVLPNMDSDAMVINKRFELTQILTPEFWKFFPQFTIQTLQLLMWPTGPLKQSTESCNELMRQAPGIYDKLASEVPEIMKYTRKGWLKIYRTQSTFDAAVDKASDDCVVLNGHDAVRQFDPIAAPNLKSSVRVIGGLYFPNNYWAFPESVCKELASYMKTQLGVRFLFSTTVTKLSLNSIEDKYSLLMGKNNSTENYDLIVLCGGVGSSALAKEIGKRVPVYPLRGNTMTINGSRSPALTKDGMLLWDVENHCILSRMGNTVRVSAQGEFSAMPKGPAYQEYTDIGLRKSLQQYVSIMLPLEQEYQAVLRSGDRPITPDWAPIVGHLDKNVWVNTGHGTAGWTMSFASASALAEYICSGKAPEVLDALSPERFQWF